MVAPGMGVLYLYNSVVYTRALVIQQCCLLFFLQQCSIHENVSYATMLPIHMAYGIG